MGESGYKIGQVVELNDGRRGRIRYVGSFHLKAGEWIGIELEDASGKNDGEVQGKRYFDCDSNHGMFVQPPAISAVLEQSPAPVAAMKPVPTKRTSTVGNGTATRPAARTSILGRQAGSIASATSSTAAAKRQSILDASKARQNLNSASPTPAGRSPAVRTVTSPTKPAGKPTSLVGTSRVVPGVANTSTASLAAKRTSLAGRPTPGTTTTTRPARTSTVGSSTTAARPPTAATATVRRTVGKPPTSSIAARPIPAAASRRTSIAQDVLPDDSAEEQDQDDGKGVEMPNGPALATTRQVSSSSTRSVGQSANAREAPGGGGLSRPTTQQLSAQNRKIEDLETKLRVMEKQQLDSRDRLKEMEKLQNEKERYESIIQKLQAKIQPQVEEIQQLRKEIKETNSKLEVAEQSQMSVDEAIELATLDREMAEELAEGYKAELDALRSKHEELVLEADILRAENEDLGREMSPEERNSMGFAQLERSNERLREALIRLRDMTQDTEADLKYKIKELEDDVEELTAVKAKYEETRDQLSQTQDMADALRQQLETAQGSEDMIEELTEKNMSLTEQIEELRVAVQDLEDLREVNDELELNHIEHEKVMQEDIDFRDSLLLEQARKSSEQDVLIEELEYTVGRFRELVANLNSDLEEMRASQQITEAEANELSSKTKAMMDMNMRLQQSATKTQVKIIDAELKRLEAQEAMDQLAIVKRFMPDSYRQHQDSTMAFLRFKRISFKATMLHGFLKDRVIGNAVTGHEEDIFVSCELLDKLIWVITTSNRFVKFIVSCPLETWERMSGTTYDLEPVERAFNNWIEALKRDELKEAQCVIELQRTMSVLEHLGERFFTEGGLTDYAEEVHLHATLMQSNLESAAAAVTQIKGIATARVQLPTDADEDDEQEVEAFKSRADDLVAQVRSIRVVASKSLQQLNELTTRSLTLEPSTQGTIESTRKLVEAFAVACRQAGGRVAALVNDDSRTDSLTYEHVANAITSDDVTPFSSLVNQASSVSNAIQSFSTLTTTLSATVEFPAPPAADDLIAQHTPWAQLAEQLRAQNSASIDLDAEISRLNDTLTERSTVLALKDKTISELGVTIEVLQKRADDGNKATVRAREIEAELENATKKRTSLEQRVANKEDEIKHLKAERETWAAAGAAAGAVDSSGNVVFDEARIARAMEDMAEGGYLPASVANELDTLQAELDATRSVVQRLRQSAVDASFQGALSDGILGPIDAEALTVDVRTQRAHAKEKEALDAMKALRQIVNHENAGTIRMRRVNKGDRLKWRPAHERLAWQVGVKREEWEDWREWIKSVAKQEEQEVDRREKIAERSAVKGENESMPRILARLKLRSPRPQQGKAAVPIGEIRIVDPNEWEGLTSRLGLSF